MDCLGQILLVLGAVVPGHQYVCPYGKPQEKVQHKFYDGSVGAYGGQGVVACKPADYYDISCVEQELQGGGAYEGYGKQAYLLKKRTMAHIYLIILCHRNILTDMLKY